MAYFDSKCAQIKLSMISLAKKNREVITLNISDEERKKLLLLVDYIRNKAQACVNHLQDILSRDRNSVLEEGFPDDEIELRMPGSGYPNERLYGTEDLYPETKQNFKTNRKEKEKMYNITKEEVLSLLENMRQIRQKAGEMIAFLEHMMQLQQSQGLRELAYNPDDYLEEAGYEEFDRVHQALYEGCSPYGCGSAHPINRPSGFMTTVEQEVYEAERGNKQ